MNALSVLDLFSAAAGGWSLGMHRAGFHTVAACEFLAWRRELYLKNNPGVRMYDDVRNLTGRQLLQDLGFLPRVVVGSPPCQDISSANTNGKGVDGEKSGLFFEATRIIGEIRPRWFALENSDRVRTRGYDRIAAALEAHNYHCWPLVVGTGNAGGSHQRKRAWILGMDADAASSQGRAAGQSRLDSNTDSADWGLSRADRRGRFGSAEEGGGAVDPLGTYSNGSELRVECSSGAGWEENGKEEIISGLARVFRGPVGSPDFSSHIRAYDGVPSGLAEQCREAYGDAVAPQIPEIIGKAILRTEQALAAIYGEAA